MAKEKKAYVVILLGSIPVLCVGGNMQHFALFFVFIITFQGLVLWSTLQQQRCCGQIY